MVREGERCFDVVSILVFLRLILLLLEDLHLVFTFVWGTITFWTLALLPTLISSISQSFSPFLVSKLNEMVFA